MMTSRLCGLTTIRAPSEDPRPSRARLSRHVRGYRKPLPVPARPDVSVTAVPLPPVGRRVAGPCVDDRDISEKAHFDILCFEARDGYWSRGLCKKLALVAHPPLLV